jgi:hypothetical protein
MAFSISKKGPKSVPGPKAPKFVLGSKPPGMRSPRIKPLSGQTMYGKTDPQISPTEAGGAPGPVNLMNPQEP